MNLPFGLAKKKKKSIDYLFSAIRHKINIKIKLPFGWAKQNRIIDFIFSGIQHKNKLY